MRSLVVSPRFCMPLFGAWHSSSWSAQTRPRSSTAGTHAPCAWPLVRPLHVVHPPLMRRWRRAHLSASTGPVQHRLALQASRTFASPRRAGGRLAHHSQQAHHPQLRPNCSGIEPFPLASPRLRTPPACASVLDVCNGGFACTGCAPRPPPPAPLCPPLSCRAVPSPATWPAQPRCLIRQTGYTHHQHHSRLA